MNQQAAILRANEGGVTFSGGEPLQQAEFVAEVIDLLDDVHVLLDTSGYGQEQDFRCLVDQSDLIYFDLKLIDSAAHRRYTGCDNTLILSNLHILDEIGKPFVVRVPLVPGITDTNQNLADIAQTLLGMHGLQRVDLLPYNKAAGSKYEYTGMQFKPDYDEFERAKPQHGDLRAGRYQGGCRMNDRLTAMKERVRAGEHRSLRQDAPIDVLAECESGQLSWCRRVACLVRRQCEAELVIIAPDERIVFTRTIPAVPPIYSEKQWTQLTAGRTLHELGPVSNICADWNLLLSQGLLGRKEVALTTRLRQVANPNSLEFIDSAVETIDALLGLADRYAHGARELGRGILQIFSSRYRLTLPAPSMKPCSQ